MNKLTILLILSFLLVDQDLLGQKSISVELRIKDISIDTVASTAVTILKTKLTTDNTSAILTIGTFGDKDLGVRFVYYSSFKNISGPGQNPDWKTRKMLEIEFYKRKTSINEWSWFSSSVHIIDEKIGDGKFTLNSLTYNDYNTNREYGIGYDFRVE